MSSIRPLLALTLLCAFAAPSLHAQDWFKTETSSGASTIRLAPANFKLQAPEAAAYKRTFDTVLAADLANAGIFDLVSKSLQPTATPGTPSEINLPQWSAAPTSAAMVAFGGISLQANKLTVNGFLFDAKNTQYPQILAKQYTEDPSDESARQIAHRFADEIILRLGGGINGIAETKIYFVHVASPTKEIWQMDYDGANPHPVTRIGGISLSPRISPDNSRVAFSSLEGNSGFQIRMFSLLLGRTVAFPAAGGTNLSPAWSPNGRDIAFSSSRSGDPEIWISDLSGQNARRITTAKGPDVSPTFNPKTGAQIAWISGRTGLPQLYIMDSDGSNVQRMTDGGYATSPSWSPNGQFLAFAWNRKYGPGAPGGQDIYVMEVATKRWIQITHDIGPCDFPSWSPDGRHLVFANSPNGRATSSKIITTLADGTQRQTLAPGDMPNWSWK